MLWRVRQEKDGLASSEPGNVSCTLCHLSCTWLQGTLGKPGTTWHAITRCQLEVPSDMRHFLILCMITFEETCPQKSDSVQPIPWAFTMPHLQRPSTPDSWSPPGWFLKIFLLPVPLLWDPFSQSQLLPLPVPRTVLWLILFWSQVSLLRGQVIWFSYTPH